jgi:uncharacterized membrane protein HdeD (DUF308 family)
MRVALNIIAALMLLMGTTWFLQGINVVPGSFMTGQPRWAVYGSILDIAAGCLLVVANRRRQLRHQ